MNYPDWERQFKQRLRQKLQLTPEQVNFHWQACYSQRLTAEEAVAYLMKTHELYPELGILPTEPNERRMGDG